MPPKKDKKGDKKLEDALEIDDGTGIMKKIVQFTFNFEVQKKQMEENQEENSYLIMWEWFEDSQQLTRLDTPLIDQWETKEDKNLVFEKIQDKIQIDDHFCQQLCSKQFYIYIVRAEDFIIKQEIQIDLSQLLTDQAEHPSFSYKNDRLQVPEIELFSFKITADQGLLSPTYKHYLNPLEIEIIGAKNLPLTQKPYQPIYVQYQFYDNTTIKTPGVISREQIVKWRSKHVFLLGLMDQKILKDQIQSKFIEMQIHDCDKLQDNSQKEQTQLIDIQEILQQELLRQQEELEAQQQALNPGKKDTKKAGKDKEVKKDAKKETKKDAKKDSKKNKDIKIQDPVHEDKEPDEINDNHYGQSMFHLQDLLNMNYKKHFQLRSPVIPIHKLHYLEQEKNVLTLNTTARQHEKVNNNEYQTYFESDCFLVIAVKLEHNLDSFVQEVKQVQEEKIPEKKDTKQPPKGKVQDKQKHETEEKAEIKVDMTTQNIYERCAFVFPYKNGDFVVKLQNAFYQHNRDVFQIELDDYVTVLNQRILTSEEKQSPALDFLGGFEVYDEEQRIYIIEGLSEGGIAKLMEQIPIEQANTDKFKIFRNKTLKFPKRLFTDFNVDIKKIKLREKLDNILKKQEIYIRSKYPDSVRNALFKIDKIRRQFKLQQLVDYDLFPLPEELIQIERQLGMITNSPFDLFGQDIKKKKFVSVIPEKPLSITFKSDDPQDNNNNNNQKSAYEVEEEQIQQRKKDFLPRIDRKHLSHTSVDKNRDKLFQLQMRERLPPSDEPYYIYASQKKNIYHQQVEELEEKMRNDHKNFYTYSKNHLGLSIAPKEPARIQQLLNQDPNADTYAKKPMFISNIRTTEEKRKHPLFPCQDKLDWLREEKYHEFKKAEKEAKKPKHGLPLADRTKEFKKDFVASLDKYFSEIPANQKFEPNAKEKEEMTYKENKRLEAESKAKFKGTQTIYVKNTRQKDSQLDKYQDLLEGKAVKKGFQLSNKQLKTTKLTMTKAIGKMPVSIFFEQEYQDYVFNPFERKSNSPQKQIKI